MTEVKQITAYVIKELKRKGVIVQKYEAVTSSSVYLKLDYGASHTVRISDHHGKKHLKYRYNLLSCEDVPYVEETDYPRYYYPFEDVDMMINRIIATREVKIAQFGNLLYTLDMKRRKQDLEASETGPWSKTKEV